MGVLCTTLPLDAQGGIKGGLDGQIDTGALTHNDAKVELRGVSCQLTPGPLPLMTQGGMKGGLDGQSTPVPLPLDAKGRASPLPLDDPRENKRGFRRRIPL